MRIAAAGTVAVAACALSGCGALGAGYKGVHPVAAAPITAQVIARYPAGTPQRTVLEWYRALQQGDPVKMLSFYAPNVRISSPVIGFERAGAARYVARAQPPRIIAVSIAQARATVFTVFAFRWSAPDGRSYVYMRPQAFELERSQQAWRLSDNYFLESTASGVPQGPCSLC